MGHLDYCLKTNSKLSLIYDYQYIQNIRKILGEKWYEFARSTLPGWYRNPESAIFPLLSKHGDVVQIYAKYLLDNFDDQVKYNEQGHPCRQYHKPKRKPAEPCFHSQNFPSVYCYPQNTHSNQNNP